MLGTTQKVSRRNIKHGPKNIQNIVRGTYCHGRG